MAVSTLHFERYTPRLLATWPAGLNHQSIPGTMVFSDISGFTAMSERLAKKGRVGSEEVAAALTTVFSELLDIAIIRGGDLLKFGGDALLLLFTGSNHCQRGAAAAFEMQQRIQTAGKIDTRAGRVALSMTVGVHTGSFDMFVVGDHHRELIVAGQDVSLTVDAEGSAQRGEIVVSSATRDLLDSAVVEGVDGRLLLTRAPVAPPATSDEVTATADLAEYLPLALRPVVGSAAGEAEHRRAVVAFIKFQGLDSQITTRGRSAVWDDIDGTVRIIQAAAEEFGVTFFASDIDADSVKIILIAGAPTTTDNDAERMLRALRRIVESQPPLLLRIGVNAGTLFAGDVGSSTRADYTVIGDAVNLAARIMGQAPEGQILAEATVLDRSGTVFQTTEVEPFYVKGKSAPVHASLVGKIIGTHEVGVHNELPFVGRAEQLRQIIAEYESVAEAGASILSVSGPAGVGKSRLIGEARTRTEPGSWTKIGCERYESTTPYHALRTLARTLLQIPLSADPVATGVALSEAVAQRIPHLQPWLPLLALPIGATVTATPEVDALSDKFRKERTQDILLDFLSVLLPQPAAIVFDNSEWLDETSRETIERAVSNPQLPWLVCLVGRTHPPVSTYMTAMDLGPLTSHESLELARNVAVSHPVPHHELVLAVERSEGSPLFLVSLVEAAIEGGELPANVEDLINARFDRLDPGTRKVLRYASVIGRRFEPELLAESIGDEVPESRDADIWTRLDEYLEPSPDGDMMFRQNLFRDVAYEGLPFRLRIELHRRVGVVLEARPGPQNTQLLSQHFSLAGDHERSWKYSVDAGDKASTAYANIDAATFYRRGLDAARRLRNIPADEVARVSEALGTVSELAGLYDDADAAFNTTRKQVRADPVAEARLLGRQGLLRERTGNYTIALRWLTRGLKRLAAADPSESVIAEQAELVLAYAGVQYRQGRYHHCVKRCREALALPGLTLNKEAHARYLLCLAFAHLANPASETEGKRALEIFEELKDLVGTANVLNNLGTNAYYRGEWNAALDYWLRSREAREACGDIVGAATQTNNLGEIYSDQGKWDDARECFTEALRIWEGARYEVGIALAMSNLGRIEARAQNWDRADELLTDSAQRFNAIGAGSFELEAKVRQAENLIFADDPRAEASARGLLATLSHTPGSTVLEATVYRILGYALWQQEKLDEAQAALRRSLEKADEAGTPFEESLTRQALAHLTDDRALAISANEIFDRMGIVCTPHVPVPT